jgi:putative ABC transport system permease protein
VVVGVGGVGSGAGAAVTASFQEHRQVDLIAQAAPPDGLPTTLAMPAAWEADLSAMPGVRSVAPSRLRFADAGGPRFLVLGVGPDSHDPAFRQADGPVRDAVASGLGASVTQAFASTHHVPVASTIRLQGVSGEPLRVLDIVGFPAITPGGEVIVSNAVFQRAFGAAGPNRLEVRVSPGSAGAVRDRLQALAATDHVPLTILTGGELADAEVGLVAPVVALFALMTWVVAIGTFIGLAASLVLSTTLRRREIAMLRMIGATRRQVAGMLALEALAATALGLVMGTAVGYGVSIAAAADAQRFFGLPLPASLPAGVTLLVLCAGLGASATLAAATGLLGTAADPVRSLAAD